MNGPEGSAVNPASIPVTVQLFLLDIILNIHGFHVYQKFYVCLIISSLHPPYTMRASALGWGSSNILLWPSQVNFCENVQSHLEDVCPLDHQKFSLAFKRAIRWILLIENFFTKSPRATMSIVNPFCYTFQFQYLIKCCIFQGM